MIVLLGAEKSVSVGPDGDGNITVCFRHRADAETFAGLFDVPWGIHFDCGTEITDYTITISECQFSSHPFYDAWKGLRYFGLVRMV